MVRHRWVRTVFGAIALERQASRGIPMRLGVWSEDEFRELLEAGHALLGEAEVWPAEQVVETVEEE